jgi:hypothetical protein
VFDCAVSRGRLGCRARAFLLRELASVADQYLKVERPGSVYALLACLDRVAGSASTPVDPAEDVFITMFGGAAGDVGAGLAG